MEVSLLCNANCFIKIAFILFMCSIQCHMKLFTLIENTALEIAIINNHRKLTKSNFKNLFLDTVNRSGENWHPKNFSAFNEPSITEEKKNPHICSMR